MLFPKGYGLGYGVKVLKGSEGFKSPMLVVGANAYMRDTASRLKVKGFADWDMHLLFFPTADNVYRVGILGVSRHNDNQAFLSCGEADTVDRAINNAFRSEHVAIDLRPHAMLWLQHAIYRCPKVALKDLLSLESYSLKKTA